MRTEMISRLSIFARQGVFAGRFGSSGRPSRRGLTLVELLISLLITSLISLGVASIIHAAAYGTSSRREIRDLDWHQRLSITFSTPSTRPSLAVLGWGCRFVARSSRRMGADCRRRPMCLAAQFLSSTFPLPQTMPNNRLS